MTRIEKIFLTALIMSLFVSCGKETSSGTEPTSEEKNLSQLRISKKEFDELGFGFDSVSIVPQPMTLKLNGYIEVPPNNKAVISAFKGGFIKEIPVLVGDKVKKNQILGRLENLEFLNLQKRYLESGHDLKYLEAEYTRQRQLYEERISSEKKFQQAENDYRTKLVELKELGEILRMLHLDPDRLDPEQLRSTAPIFSPLDGSVSKIYVYSGVYVAPGEPILEVVNAGHIHIELKVYEKDAPHLSLEQRVKFRVPEFSGEVFTGKIYRIGNTIQDDRTVITHVHLDKEENEIFMPGMYVEAEIETGESNQSQISEFAVVQTDFKYFAFELVGEESDQFIFERRSMPVKSKIGQHYVLEENSGLWAGKKFLRGEPDQLRSF